MYWWGCCPLFPVAWLLFTVNCCFHLGRRRWGICCPMSLLSWCLDQTDSADSAVMFKYCRSCERLAWLLSSSVWLPGVKRDLFWTGENGYFWQRKKLPLASLARYTLSISIPILVPFFRSGGPQHNAVVIPFLPWVTRLNWCLRSSDCMEGAGLYLVYMTQSPEPLLPRGWMWSRVWVDLVRLQDVEEEG